ncbi:uncharacterized protein LOC113492387 [Trichoplusia ni]|uniref:Uncharacterized protein LOC113492387 n=1 Tax=Trichoplusia ni TaxID=7111 RepID=A0A7E5VBQ6_TRINI|nr:uncharacterized protein LOC113492387 [Trichoplusia ni]
MIELYKDLYNKDQKRTELIGPGVKVLRLIHYIINMELVHFLEVEIDEFIHVLEVSAHNDMVQGNHMASALRNGPEVEEESSSKEEEEAKVKSRTREEFLMKRLGSNITTTKKRFIDHWPVEETWSLEGANIYQK